MAIASGKVWATIITIVLAILKPLLKIITPKLEEELKVWIRDFKVKCLATPNPWDDLLAEFLGEIFDVE
jgi:hypothetical protein